MVLSGCADHGTSPAGSVTSLGVDLNGEQVTLEQYRGRVVVANFWTTWVLPCQKQLASLDSLQAEYPTGVAVIAVNFGEPADSVLQYLEGHPVNLRVTLDSGAAMRALTNSHVFPTSLVFTPQGRLHGDIRGSGSLANLEAVVLAAGGQP